MSTAMRWSKFWWSDWRADPALRVCGYAARGMWMDMLALMHEGEPYGHLTINGKPATPRHLSSLAGGSEKEVAKLVSELEEAGVFSRTTEGVIYSRRMVRDKAASEEGRANGKRGGNPSLTDGDKGGGSGGGNEGGLTPPVIDGVKLEARSRSREKKEPPDATRLPPKGADGRGSRLAGDWQPERGDRDFASGLGLAPDTVADGFRDFWIGKAGAGATKRDWPATWRNWCRREAERAPKAKPEFRNGFFAVIASDREAEARARLARSTDEPNPFLTLEAPRAH